MIEPPALLLSMTMLLLGVVCVRFGRDRAQPRPTIHAGDPVFEAEILIAYGCTAQARTLLELAGQTRPLTLDVVRRLAELDRWEDQNSKGSTSTCQRTFEGARIE